MPKYKMMVMVNAVDGQDDEFNRWYDEQHLADVCAVPGITAGNRFRRAAGDGRWNYLTIYDVETDDPAAVAAELEKRAGTPQMAMTDTLDMSSIYMTFFEASGK